MDNHYQAYISILIDCKPTLLALHIIFTLFIDSTLYLYRVFTHLLSLPLAILRESSSRVSDQLPWCGFLLSIRTLFPPQLLCPRTYFALSKALLFLDHIVAHRLLRRSHDGASASPTFTLGGRCGFFFFGAIRDDDESILFYLTLPQLWRTRTISFLSSILSPPHLLLLFTLTMPDDFSLTNSLSPFLHVGAASPSTCN